MNIGASKYYHLEMEFDDYEERIQMYIDEYEKADSMDYRECR